MVSVELPTRTTSPTPRAIPRAGAPIPSVEAAAAVNGRAPSVIARAAPAERITALVEIQSRNGQPWAFVFRGGVVRVGRGTDNEIVLADDRVSRRHGQLTARQGTLVWTDLASSNGSQVNGAPAREIALGVGDVVRVGNSTLTIRPGG